MDVKATKSIKSIHEENKIYMNILYMSVYNRHVCTYKNDNRKRPRIELIEQNTQEEKQHEEVNEHLKVVKGQGENGAWKAKGRKIFKEGGNQ